MSGFEDDHERYDVDVDMLKMIMIMTINRNLKRTHPTRPVLVKCRIGDPRPDLPTSLPVFDSRTTSIAAGIEPDDDSIVHRWLKGRFLVTCVFLPQDYDMRFDQITPMLQLAGILVAQEFLATHASGAASGIVIGDPSIITLQPTIQDNPCPATPSQAQLILLNFYLKKFLS
jgi:hypothetical protein